ncbi:hypothetical protein [Kitasatospora sp. NPDC085879]|uniref:hypothetical protein n=1 Tax=Kitasatospora sp. NPDC085879 TaxID=3154769 RepID=UPI003413CDA8
MAETGDLAGFFRTYLNVEVAFHHTPAVRSTLSSFAPEWGESIKREFSRVLETKELSVGQYCEATWVDFESEAELYAYLGKVYQYLFLNAEEVPLPPD